MNHHHHLHHHPHTIEPSPATSISLASSIASSSTSCHSPPLPPYNKPSINLLPLPNHTRLPHSKLIVCFSIAIIFYLGYITGSANLKQVSKSVGFNNIINRYQSESNQIPFLVNLPHHQQHTKIPRYLHYVFGMSPDFGGKPFGFIHFAALQSALQILRPEKIFIHYAYLPTGWWFERVLEIEQVKLVKVRDVTEIFGRPVEHFAHKADIIRLEALRDYGGIYLDFDVFIVRDFTDLLNEDVVLGQEQSPETKLRSSTNSKTPEILGVCNAIILAKPFSPFISRWISSYRTFDKTRWADHSASIPWSLALKFPQEVTILGPEAFFYPLWHEDHLWLVHRSLDWSFDNSGQLAYHAWSSLSYENELKKYDPDLIHVGGGIENGENSFSYFVRRYIHLDIQIKWSEAKKLGEL
ncbi:hypothetical protein CROQUDRAFT_671048 [Cronartium quercuum f. sp. fusiforme G11]|uniref:Glycosyltransferase n=1 Tax=Cronartium quercuum f. sp. fusiforme G11 TaxID=708437 RepID=A0A9P6NIC4_9BASI|nr:hypothetical protein CROQUDRAFT_671048 [Cronartium quercuum f. sp. fusiforme G11]